MERNEIIRIFGTEYKEITKELLRAAGLKDEIEREARIGIKPNLVDCTPASFGATTHPEIVEGVIEYLNENGFNDISIIEGSWVGGNTLESFEYCGFNSISEKYGVPLIDTQKDSSFEADCSGMKLNICNHVKDFDFLINIPVLKGHCQTKITCALKNMKGLIPNSEKRRFHTLGLHEPIAHLNTGIKQNFIIVDNICGDLDFEDGGNPVVTNCIMAAKDPVLVDSYVCEKLGYSVNDVRYVTLAAKLGVGESDLSKLKLITLNEEADFADESARMVHRLLDVKYHTEEVDSCSACYANLCAALMRIKEEGNLSDVPFKIGIGQGYKGKSGKFGVGNCTKDFLYSVKGCPPSEDAMYEAINDWLNPDK